MFGRIVEERQQFVRVVRDPLDDLGVLRAVLLGKGDLNRPGFGRDSIPCKD